MLMYLIGSLFSVYFITKILKEEIVKNHGPIKENDIGLLFILYFIAVIISWFGALFFALYYLMKVKFKDQILDYFNEIKKEN